MAHSEIFEVYAVKYAVHDRVAQANFLRPVDPHDATMPIDYFVWAAVSKTRTVVIDTGFSAEVAAKRGRTLLRCPTEGLGLIGIDAATVSDVVITHMHYDHVGNFGLFPKADFHLQDDEMAFATGRHMRHGQFCGSIEVEDVVGMVRKVYEGRVVFHNGDTELSPGLSLHRIGGHTDGLQSVRVKTARGWIVLASDAAHLYAHLGAVNPFPIVFNIGEMIDGYDILRHLADSDDHIVPGHDPKVMEIYSAPTPELQGIVVRLDVAPS
jgi:glyoxylase-like metal-dependent hydrolase (beta-lactamase superfamily II)